MKNNNSKKIKILFITISLVVLALFSGYSQQVESGLNSISNEDLMEAVKLLSSSEFDGRLSGSKGYNKAANFIVKRFAELGLEPAGEEGLSLIHI